MHLYSSSSVEARSRQVSGTQARGPRNASWIVLGGGRPPVGPPVPEGPSACGHTLSLSHPFPNRGGGCSAALATADGTQAPVDQTF